MRRVRFILGMALFGYLGGNLVGWGLSEDEVRKAMCSYYPDWEFCGRAEKEDKMKDLAIAGLSRKVHELERKVMERQAKRDKLCVKAYRLNIRLYPLDGKVIGVYKRGARVEVIDRIGGWVRTEEGWVSEKYLEACDNGKGAPSSGVPDRGSVSSLPPILSSPASGDRKRDSGGYGKSEVSPTHQSEVLKK